MDMNQVAKAVTKLEGKKKSLPIGQVKEVLRCLRELCRSDREAWSRVQDYLRYDLSDCLKSKRSSRASSTRVGGKRRGSKKISKK